jgi:hypothetical protein
VLVVEFFQYLQQYSLEVKEVHHHTGSLIDLTRHGHFQHVVMAMAWVVVAGAECGSVPRGIPLRFVIPVGRGKLNAFGQ